MGGDFCFCKADYYSNGFFGLGAGYSLPSRCVDVTYSCLKEDFTEDLAIVFRDAFKTNTNVKTLALDTCYIDDHVVSLLFDGLAQNTVITGAYFHNNAITSTGANSIADALKQNSAIQTLDLRNNFLGDSGAKKLAKALKSNTGVTSVDVRDNGISDEGTIALAQALKQSKTLQTVLINHNVLSTEGEAAFNAIQAANDRVTREFECDGAWEAWGQCPCGQQSGNAKASRRWTRTSKNEKKKSCKERFSQEDGDTQEKSCESKPCGEAFLEENENRIKLAKSYKFVDMLGKSTPTCSGLSCKSPPLFPNDDHASRITITGTFFAGDGDSEFLLIGFERADASKEGNTKWLFNTKTGCSIVNQEKKCIPERDYPWHKGKFELIWQPKTGEVHLKANSYHAGVYYLILNLPVGTGLRFSSQQSFGAGPTIKVEETSATHIAKSIQDHLDKGATMAVEDRTRCGTGQAVCGDSCHGTCNGFCLCYPDGYQGVRTFQYGSHCLMSDPYDTCTGTVAETPSEYQPISVTSHVAHAEL